MHNDREEGANAGRGASLPHLHALMFPDTGVWGSYAVYGRETKGNDLILMSIYVAKSIIATYCREFRPRRLLLAVCKIVLYAIDEGLH